MPRALRPSTHSPNHDQDPFRKPALQSLALHGGLVAALLAYALVAAHLHGNTWGNNSTIQGAIQATMVTSAPSIPLPRDEQKPTDKVLATETPSPAPAPPAPKAPSAEEEKSIPIPTRQPVKAKLEPKKTAAQPVQQHIPVHAATQTAARQQQEVRPTNRASYGEAAPATPRSMAQAAPGAQVNVQGGDFGARFPWYVDVIRRKTAQNWYKQEVDPGTPDGARVFLSFSVSRTGEPSGVRIAQSSGSPSLDTSCVRAVQRVDTYDHSPPVTTAPACRCRTIVSSQGADKRPHEADDTHTGLLGAGASRGDIYDTFYVMFPDQLESCYLAGGFALRTYPSAGHTRSARSG